MNLDSCISDISTPQPTTTHPMLPSARARYRAKRVTVLQRVESWVLYRSGNECFCDRCIASEVAVADIKKVTVAMRKLGLRESRYFSRWRGTCFGCGKEKLVIFARRLTWA